MYYFTSREIANELIRAKNRKVMVRIVLDQGQETKSYSKSRYLIKEGFEVRYHIGPGIMHNKFALIDGKELLTGSFNWTATANEKNEENLLILTDKDLIKKYEERFEYLWQSSRAGAVSTNQKSED
jgi:phosphatidylserine/phosphatidylglycerophosphate/cardiolipin synthase-like enzyme